jgi:hypothetical protein
MSLLDKASLIVTPNAYKASKLYSVIPSDGTGDMTVVRATTATRVNSSSLIESVAINIPRIDYTNGSCPSLLVEPQRTNLFTYSDQFDNIAWSKFQATVTANNTTSPEGISSADKLESSTNGTAVLFRTALTGATASTISVYAKAGTNDVLDIGFTNVTDFTVKANLTTGTITSATSGITGTITNAGNGWYRVTATRTMTASGTAFINSATTISGRFIYIWGSQLELGSYPTSYIPTVASTVTRNADVISKTGISSLIGQTEGTLFFDGIVNNIQNTFSNILNTNKNNTTLSTFALIKLKATDKLRFDYFLGNGTSTSIQLLSTNSFANGIRTKVAIRYKSGDFAMYVNGVLQATSSLTYTNNGTKTELFLNDPTTFFAFQESVSYNSVQLYKTPLTNTELQSLTTL